MSECRLCLQIRPPVYIFDESKSLPEKIWNCCGLVIMQNDGLPNQICFKCEMKLNSLNEFKEMCVNNCIILNERHKVIIDEIADSKISIDIYDRSDLPSSPDICEGEKYDFEDIQPSRVIETVQFDSSNDIIQNKEEMYSPMSQLVEIEYNSSTSNVDKMQSKDKNVKDHQCSVCNKVFKCERYLNNHMRKIHDGEKEIFECDICHKTFNVKNGILIHIKRHMNVIDKKFSCDKCDYKAVTVFHLRRHIDGKHLNIKNYKCNLCDKLFKRKYVRDNHMKLMHKDGIDTFNCNFCPESRITVQDIVEHLKQHVNPMKLYPCYGCDYETKNYRQLRLHIETKHIDTKNYHCDTCGRIFKSKRVLTCHTNRIHVNGVPKIFECDMCHKVFNRKRVIVNHLQRHMKLLKMYTCDKCDYKSERHQLLRIHVARKHSGVG